MTAETELQTALRLDSASREHEAIGHYRKAIRAGLPPRQELIARICLGSSLRVAGRTAESLRVLAGPARASSTAFLFRALSLYEDGQHELLSRLLLGQLLAVLRDDGRLQPEGFEKALSRYVRALPRQKKGQRPARSGEGAPPPAPLQRRNAS
ncbi:tetratricopeptide repeat protein [Xylophilus sp.]|uniref:tetratricopeptide repeat protein n=1 Tax=Xylophilus sp. TaxID=2653893 RepID=UPI0013B90D77|nr:tetratricopeptide repeat protein [Xylophilus sp.]KAF1045373.1 MAG: hypothetical protein GAK38_03085 [Xylophilus sp.]